MVLPEATLALSATGDLASARISKLRLDTLGGQIEGKGEGTWDPDLTWNAELTADGIDPGRQWSEWPGRLGGRLISQGAMTAAGADLSAELEGLKGELRGYPVAAMAKVRVAGTQVEIDVFEDGHMEVSRFTGSEDIVGGAEVVEKLIAGGRG